MLDRSLSHADGSGNCGPVVKTPYLNAQSLLTDHAGDCSPRRVDEQGLR